MCIRHKWKARIHNITQYTTIEWAERKIGLSETDIIKICIKCGKVKIESYDEKLRVSDFVGTKVGKMLARYESDLMALALEKELENGKNV